MVLTVHLNENAKWHDGEPVTADDVVFTCKVYGSPTVAAVRQNNVSPFAGFKESDDSLAVEAVDEHTVKFTCTEPTNIDFLFFIKFRDIYILPEHLLGDLPLDQIRTSNYWDAPIGSGPCVYDNQISGERMEFTANKNQRTVIKALEKMKKADIYYVMCGIGPEKEELEQYVKEHHLEKNIQFAGFRSDVHEILQCADCFVLSSFREGLSVALMEAMAEGLPVVCSRIRGNVDLIEDGVGGCLAAPEEAGAYGEAFEKIFENKRNKPEQLKKMGEQNRQKIRQFSEETVDEIMRKVYRR